MEPVKIRGGSVNPQDSRAAPVVRQPELARPGDVHADRSLSISLHAMQSSEDEVFQTMRASAEQDAAAWSSKALSKARLDWTQQFLDRKEKAEADTDGESFHDFTPKLLEDFDAYSDKLSGSAPTKKSQAYMQERLSAIRTELGAHSLTFEAQARIDSRMDNFGIAIRNRGAVLAQDPSQFQTLLAEQRAEISGAPLPPLQKSALLQKATDTLSKDAVASQIQKSPVAFLQSIGFIEGGTNAKLRKASGDLKAATGNSAFDLLPFDERMKSIDTAIRAKNQGDADLDRTAEKMKKELANNAMKDGWDLFFAGKLTEGFIKGIKPLVTENDYKSLYVALRGGGPQHSDGRTLEQVYRLADAGDTTGAKKLIYQGHQAGLIKNEGADGFTGLIAHISSLDKHDGPKTPYERGKQYITLSMDPGPGVPDPVGRSRLAESIREYDNWISTGKRTDTDIQKESERIVKSYKLVNFQDTVLELPQPRAGTITRQIADTAKMEAEIKRAVDATDRLKISDDLKQVELSKLKKWRDAMERARAAQ